MRGKRFKLSLSRYSESSMGVIIEAMKKYVISIGVGHVSGMSVAYPYICIDPVFGMTYFASFACFEASDAEEISIEKFFQLDKEVKKPVEMSNVCADFSWVRGTAKKVLIDRVIANHPGYSVGVLCIFYMGSKRIYTYETLDSTSVENAKWVYISCQKRRILLAQKTGMLSAKEISYNAMLGLQGKDGQ
jgi:hypothetical protein